MKRFIITFSTIVLAQFCYASDAFNTDSTKVEYQIYRNDTVFYERDTQSDTSVFTGMKQYEEEFYRNRHHIYNDPEGEIELKNNFYKDTNTPLFCEYIVRKFLEGYGKERCAEFLETYDGSFFPASILICIDIEGKVLDLNFIYKDYFEKHMTCEDILRNTKHIEKSEPFPHFAEYEKMGIKILPPFYIPILRKNLEDYLKE